jgi:hypothetical protein
MKAGGKMNQLIWWKIFDMYPTPPNNDMKFLPDYSGDMNVAWSVIEKMKALGFETWIMNEQIYKNFPGQTYACKLDGNGKVYFCLGETAPLAICRSALLAVMEDKQHG